jgi:hypothetical protein
VELEDPLSLLMKLSFFCSIPRWLRMPPLSFMSSALLPGLSWWLLDDSELVDSIDMFASVLVEVLLEVLMRLTSGRGCALARAVSVLKLSLASSSSSWSEGIIFSRGIVGWIESTSSSIDERHDRDVGKGCVAEGDEGVEGGWGLCVGVVYLCDDDEDMSYFGDEGECVRASAFMRETRRSDETRVVAYVHTKRDFVIWWHEEEEEEEEGERERKEQQRSGHDLLTQKRSGIGLTWEKEEEEEEEGKRQSNAPSCI